MTTNEVKGIQETDIENCCKEGTFHSTRITYLTLHLQSGSNEISRQLGGFRFTFLFFQIRICCTLFRNKVEIAQKNSSSTPSYCASSNQERDTYLWFTVSTPACVWESWISLQHTINSCNGDWIGILQEMEEGTNELILKITTNSLHE